MRLPLDLREVMTACLAELGKPHFEERLGIVFFYGKDDAYPNVTRSRMQCTHQIDSLT